VTGKNGQLGRSIQKLISNFNHHEFTLVGREELDLSSPESISKYFEDKKNFEVIINCAAYTDVDKAEAEVDLAEQINHLAVKQMAEFANSQNAKFIHISTDYVFDGKNSSPYLESDDPKPLNVYGKTKLLGEKAVLKTMSNNAIVIRTSWVYSEFGHNFFKSMLKLGRDKSEINVVNDQIGSPTYATDLAKAILCILNSKRFIDVNYPTEVFHFSNSGETSWYDFAREIFKLANLDCKVKPISSDQYPTKALRPHNSTLSIKKIKKKFNLQIPNYRQALKAALINRF